MGMVRRVRDDGKVELQMTPMIDVVFQLLIFFLFTFKIIPLEGEIGVNMPPLTAGAVPKSDEVDTVEKFKIRLLATAEGDLADIRLGERSVGSEPAALGQLLRETLGSATENVEVDIDADRPLKYRNVIRVTNAVMAARITAINFTDPLAKRKSTQ